MTGRLTRGVMWDVKTSFYLKKKPDKPFARFIAGWARLMLGGDAQAEALFDAAADADKNYAPAYIGKICCHVYRGNYYKAAQSLCRNSDKLKLSGEIGRFRLGSAISVCALFGIADWADGAGRKRGPLSRFPLFTAGRILRKLQAGGANGAVGAHPLTQYLKLLRYLELLVSQMPGTLRLLPSERRDAPEPAARQPQGESGRAAAERRALARDIYLLPGILDELRMIVLNDLSKSAAGIAFTFDNPAIFSKAFLNGVFREKIATGDLREPRIILSNLRKTTGTGKIDNANKWLFLKLSSILGRSGDLELHTARELENDGWWADPIVVYTIDSHL